MFADEPVFSPFCSFCSPNIHTLGNVGFSGALHAALAPLSTKMIDLIAYEGRDVRQMVRSKLQLSRVFVLILIAIFSYFQVAYGLSQKIKSSKVRVVDLCCGVGMSTRALGYAFPHAETVIGIDTVSSQASISRLRNSSQTFFCFEVVANDFYGTILIQSLVFCETPVPTHHKSFVGHVVRCLGNFFKSQR